MRIRNFFRHLAESFKSLRRNGWMTLSSVTAVTVTLAILGVFLVVILNTVKLADDMENNVDVSVYINYGTKEAEMKKLEQDLKDLPHVKSVTFSSQDEELQKVKKSYGNAWNLFDQDNPLLDVFIVSADEPQYVKQITKEANQMTEYVHKATYGDDLSDQIFSIAKNVRTWGLIGSVVLLFVAVFLISNTIRMTILSRQKEIGIMRLVGAKNGYIRWPFFLEGAWIGVLGSLIPVLLMIFAYPRVFDMIQPTLARSNYSLIEPGTFTWQMSLLLAVLGIFIGSIGSTLSMRRFLKI